MTGKARDQWPRVHQLEAFDFKAGPLIEGEIERMPGGPDSTRVRNRHAQNKSGGEPIGWLALGCAVWPGEPGASNDAAVQQDRIRPGEGDGLFRWAMAGQRVSGGVHDGKNCPTSSAQRLFGLEHDCDFKSVETANPDQCSSTSLARDRLGVNKGIAMLAQNHRAVARGQVQPAIVIECSGHRCIHKLYEVYYKWACPQKPGGKILSPPREEVRSMADAKKPIVLLCSCEDTMTLAPDVVQLGLQGRRVEIARQLCGADLDAFRAASRAGEVVVACTAQRALFEEVAGDDGLPAQFTFVNVRETAGWAREGKDTGPKMAALIAAAAIPEELPAAVTFESKGVTLIYGRDQKAIDVAERLKDALNLTVLLLPGSDVVPPREAAYPIRQGRIKTVKGYLGAFEVGIDAFAAPAPSSRAKLVFGTARDGAVSQTDVLIDVSGGAPLVGAADLRSGYLRADPGNVAGVAGVVFEARDLVGTFDKPRYINFQEDLCAHQRSRIKGCTRCIDLCPAGAITSNGRSVLIDPHICAGCGQCAAACPTGAANYALPTTGVLLAQLRAMLGAYRDAGGREAQVLFHDREHGGALIDAAARFGDGLPARTLPFAVNEVTQIGIEAIAAAFAYGAVSVQCLTRSKPRHDSAGLRQTIATSDALVTALGYGERAVGILEADDPDQLVERLRAAPRGRAATKPATFNAAGGKREIMKLALRELHRAAPTPIAVVALPKGAGFGGIDVKVDGCTLCLSCVSACPTRALSDAQDRPRLAFDESLCVQCGLCAATCPEKVIALVPRLDFAAFERGVTIVKEEEPFCCTKCAKPFGVKSTIERVVQKLEAQHWMFTGANRDRVELIKMCEDCRVEAAINMNVDPFAGAARPAAKTSEDYFREREAKARELEMLRKIEKGEA